MNIALIGAAGYVGGRILNEALARGHVVTAIARHPEKLGAWPGFTVRCGDDEQDDSLAPLSNRP